MAIALVQSQGHFTPSGTTTACTITSSGAGNLLVVGTMSNISTGSVTGVTDNQSNTYTHIQSATNGNFRSEIWYCANATGGVTSVTATFNASSNPNVCAVLEFSGAATSSVVDTSGTITAAANPILSPALTTTTANCVIVALSCDQFGWTSYAAPYTQAPADPGYTVIDGEVMGYRITSGTVTGDQMSVTLTNSGPYASVSAAFKPAAGGLTVNSGFFQLMGSI